MVSVRIDVTHNNVAYEGRIETIDEAFLGWEDHGIFAMSLKFRDGSSYQGTPPYCLSSRGKGTAFGLGWVMAAMKVVGVEQFNELRGKQAIVLRPSPSGFISGIASLDGNRVFIFEELRNEYPKEADI